MSRVCVNVYLLKNTLIHYPIELYIFKICFRLRNKLLDIHRNLIAKWTNLSSNKKHIIRLAECSLIRSQPWVDTDTCVEPHFQQNEVSLYGWSWLLLFCYYKFTIFFDVYFMFLFFNFSPSKWDGIVSHSQKVLTYKNIELHFSDAMWLH